METLGALTINDISDKEKFADKELNFYKEYLNSERPIFIDLKD